MAPKQHLSAVLCTKLGSCGSRLGAGSGSMSVINSCRRCWPLDAPLSCVPQHPGLQALLAAMQGAVQTCSLGCMLCPSLEPACQPLLLGSVVSGRASQPCKRAAQGATPAPQGATCVPLWTLHAGRCCWEQRTCRSGQAVSQAPAGNPLQGSAAMIMLMLPMLARHVQLTLSGVLVLQFTRTSDSVSCTRRQRQLQHPADPGAARPAREIRY